ncbi:Aste57867_21426 [Aphanomyces stellatus]|uniref:Peroxisome assembly protein 12 n=1 Tax=Aphanomyces stellatus TaxID=120398 RepID=A0A485LJK4_9STRA|nr:hypothetical protein As57867_021357 [Aphanomyces stellatus]VFT98097.1 Aste57867_21426 [Aphanomyces stellatus]
MAMFLANESLGTDDAFPSTFELIMQERMAGGFQPAAQYLLTAICDTYPHLAATLPVQNFQETYALVKLAIERYCLAHYDCLLVERFYGIKRMEMRPDKSLAPLSEASRRRSLLWQIGVPYLKSKADAYYQSLLAADAPPTAPAPPSSPTSSSSPPAPPSRLETFWRHWRHLRVWTDMKRFFVDVYPAVHFGYEGTFLLYQWMYLFGYTPHFTPFLRAMKLVFARITPKDITAFDKQRLRHRTNVLKQLPTNSTWNAVRRWLYKATWVTIDYSQTIVVLAIVGFKFMEWLHSDLNPRRNGAGGSGALGGHGIKMPHAAPPPPPVRPLLTHSAISLSTETQRCGLCQRVRTNPASCISGYVFCYPCIHAYVQAHGECPVTRVRCDVSSVSRIYEEA